MKVEKIKKSGAKYKIVFDDDSKVTTYDDVIINNGLLYHSNVDLDLLNKINKDTSYYDIYYKTVNYITRKLRSEKEIIEYIDKHNVSQHDKKEVIYKLKEVGLINDILFAKAYISDHLHLSNDGPYKIRNALLEHAILEEIIDEEIAKIDEEYICGKLEKLIAKKIKSSKYTGFYLKQKVITELVNLGYERNMIMRIYDQFSFDNRELLQKEYNKLYKKWSLKYSGNALETKIKSKLYQKGFTIEEINTIMK